MKEPCIYILANRGGTLYIGVTSDLQRRVYEHQKKLVPSFTSRYNVTRLVYFEEFPTMLEAIAREKQLKGRRWEKKVALIEAMNPRWRDLSKDWRYAGWVCPTRCPPRCRDPSTALRATEVGELRATEDRAWVAGG